MSRKARLDYKDNNNSCCDVFQGFGQKDPLFFTGKVPSSVYLGRWIDSRGFGAWMMHSSNFGFRSFVVLSPEDFTSGLTGSAGFS